MWGTRLEGESAGIAGGIQEKGRILVAARVNDSIVFICNKNDTNIHYWMLQCKPRSQAFPPPVFIVCKMHAASDNTLDGGEVWEQGYCNAALWFLKSFVKRFFMDDITWAGPLSTFVYPQP